MERTIAREGKSALLNAILVELTTGLVLGLFIILLLDRMVLTRLHGISADIGSIAKAGSVSGRIRITRDDEISRLGQAMNRMLATVEETQNKFIESEKKLGRAERVAKFGHWEFEMASGRVTASAGARMIYGIGDGEYTIPDVQKLPLPAYREYLDTALQDLIEKNIPYQVEFSIRRPADNAVVAIRSIAEYDPARRIVFGVIQDITSQKEAELALRESEERYRSLTDNLPELVLVHRNGVFLYANEALSRAVGIPAAGLIGRSIFEFIAPESRAGVIEKSRQRTQGVDVEPFEAAFLGKDHEKHHGLLNAARIMYKGEPAYLVIITDISARKAMEEALAAANRKLHMLSSITRHDIRNKILGLRSCIAIAMMSAHDDSEKRLLQQMEDEARTIDEQIEFTREYQTMGVYAPQWLLVREISSRVAGQLNLGAIRVIDESNGLEIYADPLLEKVFYNLFDNAVRYGETITEIRIRFEMQGDLLTVLVEDDGVGIPAEDKMDIFERGFGKNTGLGLFMIREILSITGITVRESGVYGRGARFELLVPKGGFRLSSSGNGRQELP
jgi:PAS domain S-box-containing protein